MTIKGRAPLAYDERKTMGAKKPRNMMTFPDRYMRNPLCLKSERSRYLLTVSQAERFSRDTGFCGTGWLWVAGPVSGLMSAPATQQFSISPPRIRKLPRQPYSLIRNWLSGASVLRNTGLPAMAKPFAIGRFL